MDRQVLSTACEERIPPEINSSQAENELLKQLGFSESPVEADKKIKDSVESIVTVENVEQDIEKSEKAFTASVHQSYIHMDDAFLEYLTNFNSNVKKQEKQKLELKKSFFYFIMVYLGGVIFFPYVLVYTFRTRVTDVTVISLSIASLAEILSAIIVLPKIIAKYLFNKKEDDNKIKIISDMQSYNKEKRYLSSDDILSKPRENVLESE